MFGQRDLATTKSKGMQFEKEVAEFLRKDLIGRALVECPPLIPRVPGTSGFWRPDIAIYALADTKEPGTLPWNPSERALVECKYISSGVKSVGTYDASLARAYMQLNDIGLKNSSVRRFLLVNRMIEQGEIKRDYATLFKGINVWLVDFSDLANTDRLHQELTTIFPSKP
jgi:hypothetical protein